ncbi:MAG: amino acid adenylation domain-containing protein [Clostridia bacterium]|nr:amino acid adenylation domain-containing protein [Clostridia bacterium]
MDKKMYNLTNPQRNIWYLEQYSDNTPINVISATMYFKTPINVDVLIKTLEYIIEKSDSMRTRIVLENGVPKQFFDNSDIKNIDIINFNNASTDKLNELINKLTSEPIDIYNSSLYKFSIIKNDDSYALHVKIHHIISDAWSLSILCKKICNIYTSILNNQDITETENLYSDYIESENEYINSEKYSEDESFWLEELNDIVSLNLKKNKIINSFKSNRYSIVLNESIDVKIKEFCAKHKISIYSLFMSVIGIYFHRICSQDKFCIATPILNRKNYKEKNTLGVCISTMLLKIDINEDISFIDFANQISSRSMKCFRHQRYPNTQILEKLYGSKSEKETPYEVLFSFQNSEIKKDEKLAFDFDIEWNYTNYQSDPLMIHMSSLESDNVLKIYYDYILDIFNIDEIKDLNNRLFELLNQVLDNDNIKISQLEVLTKKEKYKILNDFNNTKSNHDSNTNIKTLFESQVLKNNSNIAIEFKEESITYEEFNNCANNISKTLMDMGITKNDVVGICLSRTPKLIETIFAVIKLGAIYLPIDPEYPINRISYMIENSSAKITIVDDISNEKLSNINAKTLNINNVKKDNLIQNINIDISPNDVMYIMYTSGSTGNPKAVMIEHKSVVNYVESVNKYMNYTSIKNVLCVTTMSFDIFVYEIFPTLCLGCTVILSDEEEQKMPDKLLELIVNKGVQKIQTTPSRFKMLLDICSDKEKYNTIKEINLGGEPFPIKLLNRIKKTIKCEINNCYGPTETTVYSTFKNLTHSNKLTVGKPINNTYIYILDKYNKLLPIGHIGEICIGGLGVGRGYLNQKELTSEKFIDNPYNEGKIYKTGDIGKWLKNGEIECLGRIDSQVKLNGHRIELKEIETQILKCKGVKEAVVIEFDEEAGSKSLSAFILGNDVKIGEIREYLTEVLPRYMIPKYITILDKFPLSHNGKIDKKELKKYEKSHLVSNTEKNVYVPPESNSEKKLVKVFSEILRIDEEQISIDDNIFDLGADSLLIIQIQVKAFSYGLSYTTQQFYKNPTIRRLAAIDTRNPKENSVKVVNKKRKYTIENMNLNTIDINNTIDIKNILLTGVTGYLGAHVLKSLIDNTKSNIYCIIRKNKNNSHQRLKDTILYYFGGEYLKYINSRIFVIQGDIEKEKFGLSDQEYRLLGVDVDEIIHTAANVRYYGEYERFKSANVDATIRIAEFATEFNAKLNYISSLGVSGHFLVSHDKNNELFTEKLLYIGQHYNENPYVMSKYEAEHALYEMRDKKNLKLSVIRVGNLTGRYSDGYFQKNISENAFYNILKSMILIQKIPVSMLDKEIDFTAVDLCADALVKFVMLKQSEGQVIHITNIYSTKVSQIIELMNELGIHIDVVSDEEFGMISYTISNDIKTMNYLDGLINDINSDRRVTFNSRVIIRSNDSNKLINKLGIRFSKLDEEYLSKIIKFMKNKEYIGVEAHV